MALLGGLGIPGDSFLQALVRFLLCGVPSVADPVPLCVGDSGQYIKANRRLQKWLSKSGMVGLLCHNRRPNERFIGPTVALHQTYSMSGMDIAWRSTGRDARFEVRTRKSKKDSRSVQPQVSHIQLSAIRNVSCTDSGFHVVFGNLPMTLSIHPNNTKRQTCYVQCPGVVRFHHLAVVLLKSFYWR